MNTGYVSLRVSFVNQDDVPKNIKMSFILPSSKKLNCSFFQISQVFLI